MTLREALSEIAERYVNVPNTSRARCTMAAEIQRVIEHCGSRLTQGVYVLVMPYASRSSAFGHHVHDGVGVCWFDANTDCELPPALVNRILAEPAAQH